MFKLLGKQLQVFKRDERGVFSIFIVMIFTTLILVGGAAIDFIRYEAVRSSIQYNLDRAVLAAASMRQTQDPSDVVLDYMSKVETLSSFNVQMDGDNTSVSATARRVSATATADISTYFLRLAGVSTMTVSAASKAAEQIPNLEISLVLDVSGSMSWGATGGGTKLAALKLAANSFIDTLVTNTAEGSTTTVSIVPYATNVSVPQNMWDLYTTENLHNSSRCAIFPSGDFSTAAISTTSTLRQLQHYSWRGGLQTGLVYDYCNTAAYSEIMPFSANATNLKAKISSLQASGSTASHIGTKWGVGLLDSSAASIATNLGDADAAGRPTQYNAAGVLKVLVVMTDGQNTTHYALRDYYRTGPSDLYRVNGSRTQCRDHWMVYYYERYGSYSAYCSTVAELQHWAYNPDTHTYYEVDGGDRRSTLPGDVALTDATAIGYIHRYSWTEAWEVIASDKFAAEIGKNWTEIEDFYSTSSEADSAMTSSCNVAKANGVIVFTIAFEAPSHAETLLRNCATSTSHYYDVNGADISTAFASIAVTVTKLRLTQ